MSAITCNFEFDKKNSFILRKEIKYLVDFGGVGPKWSYLGKKWPK